MDTDIRHIMPTEDITITTHITIDTIHGMWPIAQAEGRAILTAIAPDRLQRAEFQEYRVIPIQET